MYAKHLAVGRKCDKETASVPMGCTALLIRDASKLQMAKIKENFMRIVKHASSKWIIFINSIFLLVKMFISTLLAVEYNNFKSY